MLSALATIAGGELYLNAQAMSMGNNYHVFVRKELFERAKTFGSTPR